MTGFVRLYAFISQVVPFGDPELESFYIYCRFLLYRLPQPEAPDLAVVGEIELTHLRTELTGTHDVSLEGDGEPGIVGGLPGGGRGGQVEAELAPLSEIIQILNDRFGTEFSEADRVFFEQMVVAATEDGDLAEQARRNSLENFRFGFEERFEDIIIDRRDANEDIFNRLMDDPAFASSVRSWAMRQVYDRLHDAA